VLSRLAADSGDEAEAFTEGVAEDDLVASAKSAEGDAATQATATQTAAEAKGGSADASQQDADVHGHGDCPGYGGGPHGPSGGPTGPTGPTGAFGSQGPPSRQQ
jgi:hypothetical protein